MPKDAETRLEDNMDFYRGRLLRIDLTTSTASVEPLNMQWAAHYLGGKGLLLRYLWDEVEPGLDPWSPENPLVLMTGPFAGTSVPTASRLVIGSKSPVTGILNDSYVGGSFASELKYAGYDAVIIKGRAPSPRILVIKNEGVSFVPAESWWGMKTSEVEAAVRRTIDARAKTLSIGPAGENKVRWACISNDQYHKAGRAGHGALMGDKKLKAVVVRGTGSVSVGDMAAFIGALAATANDFMLSGDNAWAHEEGTPVLVAPVNEGGALPTRNWSAGQFEGAGRIDSEAFQKIRLKKRACFQCPIACRNFHETTFRGNAVRGEGPEYETIALCGANCGIADIDALMRFNAECDEWGLDTISTGNVTALAMDLTERGIHDFGLHFGEVESYVEVPGLIARGDGIGAELALGARSVATAYGHPELAMEVKDLELPGYDPRASFGMSLCYATSDRGGCHMRSYPVGEEVVAGTLPADSLAGKAAYNAREQDFSSVKFSGIWCQFSNAGYVEMSGLVSLAWKRPVTPEETRLTGERIWNLGRLFNLREGVEPDDLPARLYSTRNAFAHGPAAGRAIGADAFKASLAEYYSIRGWDESGVPTEAKLTEIGLDVRL